MSARTRAITAALLLAACGWSCAAGRPDAQASPVEAAAGPADPPAFFRAGFDPPSEERTWERGRTLLYSVRLQDGADARQWWVQLELAPPADGLSFSKTYSATVNGAERPMTTPLVLCFASVLEQGESRMRASLVQLPQLFLERGLHASCAAARELAPGAPPTEPTADQISIFVEGWLSLLALLEVIRSSDELSDVFWKVVRKPSFFATLLALGVDLGITPDFPAAERVGAGLPPPLEALDAWTLPLAVDVNDRRALDCVLTIAPPDSPLHPAGGIVHLSGTHPEEPGRRAVIELIGARAARLPVP